jgi:tRNA-dihydrouridine synthase
MKIATIDLGKEPLFLAPMEDVTDASFRYICKEYGADMMYTEFVSADGLIRDAWKSREKLVLSDDERPVGIQIYGHIPEALLQAALMAEEARPDVIDINFGCPKSKIAKRGAGADGCVIRKAWWKSPVALSGRSAFRSRSNAPGLG